MKSTLIALSLLLVQSAWAGSLGDLHSEFSIEGDGRADEVARELSFLAGVRGMWLINSSIELGVGIHATLLAPVTDLTLKDGSLVNEVYFFQIRPSLTQGYRFFPNSPVQLSVSLTEGVSFAQPQGVHTPLNSSFGAALFVEPMAHIRFRITRWFDLGINAGYRAAILGVDAFMNPYGQELRLSLVDPLTGFSSGVTAAIRL